MLVILPQKYLIHASVGDTSHIIQSVRGIKMSYEQDFIMSTIRQPVEQMAKEAVEMLFKMIEGDYTSKKVKLPVYYIKGDTTIV